MAVKEYPLQMFSEKEFNSLKPETQLSILVSEYLCREYPHALFHTDYGTGARLRPQQYKVQAAQNGLRTGWPDLFIADDGNKKALGLFIELKKEGTRLYKKNGSPATEHIAEQQAVGIELIKHGYKFEFGVGFEATKRIIDNYLGENK